MLGIMRKYKQSIIIKGVFGIIVLSFIGTIFLVWGKGEKGLEGSDYAVRVNRTKITFDTFQQTYNRMRNIYQQFSQQPLTPDLEKQLGLKKMVLENLISTTLMRNAADQMGITVSKEEVINKIASMPEFQRNGVFNDQVYQRLLQANRLMAQTFENSVKENLLLEKTQKKITDQVKVSDADALQVYRKQHDKIDLLFASFNPAGVKSGLKLTDGELNIYIQSHQDQFRVPVMISISYIVLDPEKVAAGLNVTNDEVLAFYNKNSDKYIENGNLIPFEQVKDRVRDDALKFKAAKLAYEKVAEALNKNLKSADLKGAARILDLKIEKTPLFDAQNPPAAIAGENELVLKAFSLKANEIGGPVETKKGVYLFILNQRQPAAVPPLAQIRSRVEKLATEEKARNLAYKNAADALALMANGKTPAGLQDTGLFSWSQAGEIPRIGKSPEIMDAAFSLTRQAPVPKVPFKLGENWYAIKLKNRVEADTAEFQKTKEQIKQALLPAKQQAAVKDWLDGLRKKAKIEINPLLMADSQ